MPDTTTDGDDLDRHDLDILTALDDKPRHKSALTDYLDTLAIQTVGRRVNVLTDRGLLDGTPQRVERCNRRFVIAYTVTDAGQDVLQSVEVCRHCGELAANVDCQHAWESYSDQPLDEQTIIASELAQDTRFDGHDFDNVDFQILAAVEDEPLWKQRVKETIPADINKQWTGHRISRLVDAGLLEPVARQVDNDVSAARSQVVCFTLTEDGDELLEAERTARSEVKYCPDCDRVAAAEKAHRHEFGPAADVLKATPDGVVVDNDTASREA